MAGRTKRDADGDLVIAGNLTVLGGINEKNFLKTKTELISTKQQVSVLEVSTADIAIAATLASIRIACSAPVVFKHSTDVYHPASVTFSAVNPDGSPYVGRWKVYRGTAYLAYTSSVDEAAVTVPVIAIPSNSLAVSDALPPGSGTLRAELYAAGGTTVRIASYETSTQNDVEGYADTYAKAAAYLAEVTTKAYADGIVSAEEARAIADAQAKADAAQAAAIAASAAAVPVLAPKNRGRFNAGHPATFNANDWWTVYDTDDSPVQRGVWYSNAGTPVRISAVSGETGYTTDSVLLAKLASSMPDVAWAEKNGFGTSTNYGISIFFESMAAVTAFFTNLFANNITLLAQGYLKSHDYAEDTSGYPTTGFMLDVANQIIKSYNSKFANCSIKNPTIKNAIAYDGFVGGGYLCSNIGYRHLVSASSYELVGSFLSPGSGTIQLGVSYQYITSARTVPVSPSIRYQINNGTITNYTNGTNISVSSGDNVYIYASVNDVSNFLWGGGIYLNAPYGSIFSGG